MNIRTLSLLVAAGALMSSCAYYTPVVAEMPYQSEAQKTTVTTAYPDTWVTQPPVSTVGVQERPQPALPVGTALEGNRQPVVQQPAAPAVAPTPAPKPAVTPVAPKPAAPATPALPKTATPVSKTAVATPKPGTAAKPAAKPATPKPAATKPEPKTVDMTRTSTPQVETPKPVAETPKPAVTESPVSAAKPAAEAKPAASAAPASSASSAQDPKSITNQGPIPVATRVEGDPTRVYNPLDPSKTIRVTDKNGNPYPSGKELKVRGTNFHFYVP